MKHKHCDLAVRYFNNIDIKIQRKVNEYVYKKYGEEWIEAEEENGELEDRDSFVKYITDWIEVGG